MKIEKEKVKNLTQKGYSISFQILRVGDSFALTIELCLITING